jgi:hypothetical protein
MHQERMRRQLGSAIVDGDELELWQIRRSGSIPRRKNTERDTLRHRAVWAGNGIMLINGEVRVLYAVDESAPIVWITDV